MEALESEKGGVRRVEAKGRHRSDAQAAEAGGGQDLSDGGCLHNKAAKMRFKVEHIHTGLEVFI